MMPARKFLAVNDPPSQLAVQLASGQSILSTPEDVPPGPPGPPGTGGTVTLANRAALVAFDPVAAALQAGNFVYVESFGAYFAYQPTDASGPDGVFIISALGGGNYLRVVSGVAPTALQQGAWFIASTGDDENDGKTSGTPVKTYGGGIFARVQSPLFVEPLWKRNIVITQLDDQADGAEILDLRFTVQTPFSLQILGAYKAVGAATTLATVTPKDRAAAQLLTVTLTTLPGAAVPGDMVHNITRDSRAMIYTDTAGSLAMSQPLAAQAVGFPSFVAQPAEVDTWAPGDTVQVERGLSMCSGRIRSNGNVFIQAMTIQSDQFSVIETEFATYMVDCNTLQPRYVGGRVAQIGTGVGVYQVGCFYGESQATLFGPGTYIGGAYGFVNREGSPESIAYWDGDAIIGGFFQSGGITNIGQVYGGLVNGGFVLAGGNLDTEPVSYGASLFWGPTQIQLISGATVNAPLGGTFAAEMLITGGFGLNGLSIGSAYNTVTGVWTGNIPLTVANLDAHGGLVDPVSTCAISRSGLS